MKFNLGLWTITPGAAQLLMKLKVDAGAIYMRHAARDWGEVPAIDSAANDQAIQFGGEVQSVYLIEGHPIWVITAADRSATTILLPEEY